MKYEKPELEVLTPAIAAIQNKPSSGGEGPLDASPSYEDWE
jgi:hypothetical protein